jgi:hypothetical protein
MRTDTRSASETQGRQHVSAKLSWLDRVMDHPETTQNDLAVAMVIARYTKREYGDAALDQDYIADKAKISKRSVSTSTKRLGQLGLLDVVKGHGLYAINRYRMSPSKCSSCTLSEVDDVASDVSHDGVKMQNLHSQSAPDARKYKTSDISSDTLSCVEQSHENSHNNTYERGKGGVGERDLSAPYRPGRLDDQGTRVNDTKPATFSSGAAPKSSTGDQQRAQEGRKAGKLTGRDAMLRIEFDRWWDIYPERNDTTDMDRALAFKHFKIARVEHDVSLETLIEHAEAYERSHQCDASHEPCFNKAAWRWLRDRRWEDELR